MLRTSFTPLLLAVLLGGWAPLPAQDPGLRDTFQQAKAAWATQGDREGAAAKFGAVLAALEPRVQHLDPTWIQMLCETYNWMAILDDRVPGKRERASHDLETALALNPDFEIDRTITNARLQAAFDGLRNDRFGRLTLTLEPLDGVLSMDGKPRPPGPAGQLSRSTHYLAPGSHLFSYARPGYATVEQRLDLALRDAKTLAFKLVRTSSTVTLYTSPAGAEVLLDGKRQGVTQGQAPPEVAAYASKIQVRPDQLSAGLTLTGLTAGKHLVEFRRPCYQTKQLELGEALSTPFADHDLEPVQLQPSRAFLTVLCPVPGGELFLSGQDAGPVPVKDLAVCAQPYDLQVRFPAGAFGQRIELAEGQALTLAARPKPRLIYAGMAGKDAFAGRERLTGLLAGLDARLTQVAFRTAARDETPEDCLARLRASQEAELVLQARPVPGHPTHQVELLLGTLTGEEERLGVMPLEADPLARLVAKLEASPAWSEPWAGLTLLDLTPGGPWVLQADAAALKAGVRPHQPVLQVNGKPLATVAEFRKALLTATDGKVTISQGEAPITLAVTQQPLELPVNAEGLCYPWILADLRLRALGASGDQAGLLRLQQALALIHFREYDQALEVLRDARMTSVQGVSQGTLDYYTGVCLLHMGGGYRAETLQAFNRALKYPQATLFGPDGPLLAPLARQALDDLKP